MNGTGVCAVFLRVAWCRCGRVKKSGSAPAACGAHACPRLPACEDANAPRARSLRLGGVRLRAWRDLEVARCSRAFVRPRTAPPAHAALESRPSTRVKRSPAARVCPAMAAAGCGAQSVGSRRCSAWRSRGVFFRADVSTSRRVRRVRCALAAVCSLRAAVCNALGRSRWAARAPRANSVLRGARAMHAITCPRRAASDRDAVRRYAASVASISNEVRLPA